MTLSEFLLLQKIQNMIPETVRRTRLRIGTRMTITRVSVERPGVTEARDHYNQVTVQTSVHLARGPISIDVNTSVCFERIRIH